MSKSSEDLLAEATAALRKRNEAAEKAAVKARTKYLKSSMSGPTFTMPVVKAAAGESFTVSIEMAAASAEKLEESLKALAKSDLTPNAVEITTWQGYYCDDCCCWYEASCYKSGTVWKFPNHVYQDGDEVYVDVNTGNERISYWTCEEGCAHFYEERPGTETRYNCPCGEHYENEADARNCCT